MKRFGTKIGLLTALLAVVAVGTVRAQEKDYDQSGYDRAIRVDRYLDAEVWTDQPDGEYYVGDNIKFHFRVSRDAFVAIYVIDTRGRVKLLFPADPSQDNFVYGGTTYTLPGDYDDYDLVVTGPQGTENVQMVASRERFPIPPWYNNSGLVFDGDDPYDYMDNLNSRYFVRYDGQRFAFDRASIFVDEWENDYYRPVYYPVYPAWSVYGNVYIDYPWGATVYINGVYWGIAPLYIPRIICGWHTITIYDHDGHCWESDFHVNRHNTIILNNSVIKTRANIVSKYTAVRRSGWRNPVTNGYPNYKTGSVALKNTALPNGTVLRDKTVATPGSFTPLPKKHVHGSTTLTKSTRGYEANTGIDASKSSSESRWSRSRYDGSAKVRTGSTDQSTGYRSKGRGSYDRSSSSSGETRGKIEKGNSGSKSSSGEKSSTSRGRVKSSENKSSSSSKGKSSPEVRSGKSKSSESKGSSRPTVKSSSDHSSKSSSSSKKSGGGAVRSKSKTGGGR